MEEKIKGIHNQTIGAYWTVFALIFFLLAGIGIRIWIIVSVPFFQNSLTPVRIEEPLNAPRVKTKVNPVYPERARRAGITGEIQIEVETDLEGHVLSAEVLNIAPSFENGFGIWRLYRAAREAVLQWTFEPFFYRGQIRPAVFTVTVNFE